MAYKLQVVNFEDCFETHPDANINASTDDIAIQEAINILRSGDYKPLKTDREPGETLSLSGYLLKNDKHIATITVDFNVDVSPSSTRITKPRVL